MNDYQPSQSVANPASNSITLATINQRLADLGIAARIAPEVAQRIKDTENPDRFLQALHQAVNNPNAKTWLLTVLERHGLIGHPSANSAPVSGAETPDMEAIHSSDSMLADDAPGRMDESERMDFHVYGGSAALCFNADRNRKGMATVSLDGAASLGNRQYDWKNKIRIQMTKQELPEVLAVLLGYKNQCRFSNHGPDKTKGFSIEKQTGKFFVNVMQKGKKLIAVPMTYQDTFYVTGLFMRQLALQYGNDYVTMLPFLLQRYASISSS